MQANFFGSSRPSGLLMPPWTKAITMTATATVYSPFGFAVAADGRQRWENFATRDEFIRQSESEHAQKVFRFTSASSTLAYFIRGHIANRDRSFDVGIELQQLLPSMAKGESRDANDLATGISSHLDRYVKTAMHEQRIETYPQIFIDLLGYIDHQPAWVEIQFFPVSRHQKGPLYEIQHRSIWPGLSIVTGSLVIRDLIVANHPMFSRFCGPFDYRKSIDQAASFVQGYIEACCSPEALEFDRECEMFGGHIHVATITPQEGFRWVVAPI